MDGFAVDVIRVEKRHEDVDVQQGDSRHSSSRSLFTSADPPRKVPAESDNRIEPGGTILRRNLKVTDRQAAQILAVLIDEGRIKESEIQTAFARLRKRIAELRARLRRLESGDGPFPMERRVASRSRRRASTKREHGVKPVSPERRRAMHQQGVYLGAVRQLKPADRARVKAIRAEKGFRAAISEARKLGESG